ncbi:exported hypothetical protein [Sphingobacterium sp. PM2-P1-29]|nr:exported hypothetical protein [Sphingobacterium sp. PM2-P1-29]
MNTVKFVVGIVLLSLIAGSCSKSPSTKIMYEKDFSAGHPDWKVSGDTIVKEFELKFQDGKEPLKVSWLASKDSEGCLQVSYAKIECINSDAGIVADSIKAQPGMCGTEWESADSTRFNQMVFTGNIKKRYNVRENVKSGTFLIITGNGKILDN